MTTTECMRCLLPCSRRLLSVVAMIFAMFSTDLVAGDTPVVDNPNKIKAAFLRNFAHYVGWPSTAFADGNEPWHVGILGPDPFGEILETTFKGRTEQGRAFKVFRAELPDELPLCQIVFLAYKDEAKRRAALAELKGKPVLTVGDAAGFLQEGGIILFQVDDRVTISVNLDQARSSSLAIPSKILEVSSKIVENGVVRSRR